MSAIDNGYIDEETLLDLEEERDVQIPDRRTTVPFPTFGPGDGRSWAEYFTDARATGDDDRAVPPVTVEVLSVDLSPSEDGIGRSVRGVLDRLRDAGWPRVELHSSVVAVSDEFYAADSKKKPGQEAPENRKGDLKKPAHTVTHWWLHAAHPGFRLAFRAHWVEGVTPKGGRSFGFQEVLAADPVGMPTEFFFDYAIGAVQQQKDEPGHIYESRLAGLEAAARRRDREYNDGKSWLNRRPLFTAFKEFDAWLTEAIAITTTEEVSDAQESAPDPRQKAAA